MVAVAIVFLLGLYRKLKKEQSQGKKEHAMQIIDLEPDYKALYAQQVLRRIQERVHSTFPDANVEICEKDILRIVSTGKSVYVPIKSAGHYSHISVGFRSDGEIQMNLFSLVNFDHLQKEEKIAESEPTFEIDQWYSQRGQQMLTELITNMNSRGYTKLSINESGDVTVKENGRSVLKDHFKEIPPKEQWGRLKELMAEDEVAIQVSGKRLTVAW